MAEPTTSMAASREPPVILRDVTFGIAWNLRGDAARPEFAAAVRQAFGVPLPSPLASAVREATSLLWLGPRSWLVVVDFPGPAHAFERTRSSINAAGGALFDVSASYVGWVIEGEAAGVVLNRACPLDFRERSFPAGHCAQSLLGHVNALFYRPRTAPAYVVLVARSLARDAWHTLSTASAHQMGPTVTLTASAAGAPAAG